VHPLSRIFEKKTLKRTWLCNFSGPVSATDPVKGSKDTASPKWPQNCFTYD